MGVQVKDELVLIKEIDDRLMMRTGMLCIKRQREQAKLQEMGQVYTWMNI